MNAGGRHEMISSDRVRMVTGALASWAPRLEAVAAAAALSMGTYVFLQTILMVVHCWSPVPYWDQWEELVTGRTITWSWLISQHNEHRLLFPRLIFIADRWISGETNWVDLVANVIIQVGMAALLIYLFLRGSHRISKTVIWAAGFSLGLLFWAGQSENFTWGFQVQFFGVVLAAAGTFTVLALARPTIPSTLVVILLEAIATYTLASGIIAAFLCIVLAIFLGRPRRIVLLLSIAALALLASYLAGYRGPADSQPVKAIGHFDRLALYYLTYLGGPISEAIHGGVFSAVLIGCVGTFVFVLTAVVMLYRAHRTPPASAALLALAAFAMAMDLLTAVGRSQFGLGQAMSSRYATPAIVFWVSTALMLWLLTARNEWWRRLMLVTTLSLQALFALNEPYAVDAAYRASSQRAPAAAALLSNVDDAALLSTILPSPETALRLSRILRAAHTSVFHEPWAMWLGTPLTEHVAITSASHCVGAFQNLEKVTASPAAGWRGIGWARWRDGNAATRIVFTSSDGVVVGYGIGGIGRAWDNAAPFREASLKFQWIGDFSSTTPRTVRAFVLAHGGTAACPLGVARALLSPPMVSVLDAASPKLPVGGSIDGVSIEGRRVKIWGWGFLQTSEADSRIDIYTNLPVTSYTIVRVPRPDVVYSYNNGALYEAGFLINIQLSKKYDAKKIPHLCVATDDPVFGQRLVPDEAHQKLCPIKRQS